MHLRIRHLTRYAYSAPVSQSPHILYLRPRETSRQRVQDFTCEVFPRARLNAVLDPLDNEMIWAHFTASADALEVRTSSVVETRDHNPFDFVLKPYAIGFPFAYEPVFDFALGPYLAPPFDATQTALRNWLDLHFSDRPTETVPFLTELCSLLFRKLVYRRRDERGIQPSMTTLERGSGACRDYAVLFMELCRTCGLASRFVSGYLYAPEGDDQRTAGAMHSWAEVYLPGAGWKALDPTHGLWCDDRFVPVAHAAQAESVNPIQGWYYGNAPVSCTLTAQVDVERLQEG